MSFAPYSDEEGNGFRFGDWTVADTSATNGDTIEVGHLCKDKSRPRWMTLGRGDGLPDNCETCDERVPDEIRQLTGFMKL